MNTLDLPARSRSLRLAFDEKWGTCSVSVRTVQEQQLGSEEITVLKQRLLELLSSRHHLQSCGQIDGTDVAFVCMLSGHTTIYAARGKECLTLYFLEKNNRIIDHLVLTELECERWLWKLKNFNPPQE